MCFLLAPALILAAQSGPKERIKNIRDLSKKAGSGALTELAGYLKDPDDEVRRDAVKSIASIGTQQSLTPLVEASRDHDEEILIRTTDGLVNFYYPGYAQTGLSGSLRRIGKGIKGRFTDTNDQIIEPYIEVRPDVIDAIRRLLREGPSIDVKANAARSLGVLRASQASGDLLQAVRSKETQLLYESLVALQKIRDPETAKGIAFLLNDLNERVQISALETTGLLRNQSALPDLKEALGRARNDRIRAAALGSIAMMPDDSCRALFETYRNDRDDDVRAAAAEGYARLKNPSVMDSLVKMFEAETKPKPRLGFAFAAVANGKREMTEFSPLAYLLNSLNSASYRGIAAAYLEELARDKAIREALYPNIPLRTKAEKLALCPIFARSGDESTIPVLESLTRDAEVEVNHVAARSLRNLKARLP